MTTPLLAFLLVQALAATAAPADVYGRSVDASSRLRGTALNAYFSPDDYPVRAEREEEQGAVHFRLVIAPDGRIAGCIVTRSSGSATLDTATCRALRVRVRYPPSRRLGGGRTATSDQGIVRWRLAPGGPRRPRRPDPNPPMEEWTVHPAPAKE
jgi:TonB family protein